MAKDDRSLSWLNVERRETSYTCGGISAMVLLEKLSRISAGLIHCKKKHILHEL